MKTVYIAGKVTGLKPKIVKKKFAADEETLRGYGYRVINPVTLVNDNSCDWKKAMKICIAELIRCDAVYAQIDWRKSKGANIEIELAVTLGIPVFESLWLLKTQLKK